MNTDVTPGPAGAGRAETGGGAHPGATRRLIAPVLAAALALAGCSAPLTPAAVPTSTTPGPTSSAAPAPGNPPGSTPPAVPGTGLAMPDPALTPGAVLTTNIADVCTPGWSSAHRDVPDAERQAVFAAYHVPVGQRDGQHYEIDHLIALELGGSNAQANLWPEPQTENDKSGPDKDALEAHLHALVCDHQLALTTAQHAIATNWVQAWKTYEHIPTDPSGR